MANKNMGQKVKLKVPMS